MIDNNYFDTMEAKDYKKLCDFNDQVKWFKPETIEANPRFSKTDVTAIDKKNRKVHIELKTREGELLDYRRYGDVLVEPRKLSTFTDIMESGHTLDERCLYMNFVDDGVIIFNFNELGRSINIYTNHYHYNNGKQQYEHETRFGLPYNKAIIYAIDKDTGEYVQVQ